MNVTTAYVAGLFDGEGSIGIYRSGRVGVGLRVSLASTDKPIIDYLLSTIGGFTWTHQSSKPNHKRAWYWRVVGKEAKEFLGEVLPYLRIKKSQAFEALKTPMGQPFQAFSQEDRDYLMMLAKRLKDMKKL